MKKVLLLIAALLAAPGLISANIFDEISHDYNNVSNVVQQQTHVLTHTDLPVLSHVVNHQAHVIQGTDLPVVAHAIDNQGKIIGHFVTSNLGVACRAVMGKVVGQLTGLPCKTGVTDFVVDCNAEMDAEAPEVGITVCSVGAAAITKACTKVVTTLVAGDAIHQACDNLTD